MDARRRSVLLAFCGVLPFAGSPAFADVEKRVALLIGVGGYSAVPPLKSPENDVSALASKLSSYGFSTDLLTDPDKDSFRRALVTFERKSDGADVALVYYAGHAIQMERKNYLFPADANPGLDSDLEIDTVSLDRVGRAVQTAKLRILIIDACRNNPFAGRYPSRNRDFSPGLAPAAREPSTLTAFSAGPGQTADDGNTEHSPYASALLHQMDTPGLELSVMFLRVSGEVRKATRNKQTPEVTDGRDGTEFYFVSTASKRAGISAAPVSVNQSAPQPAPLEKDLVRPSDRYQVVRDTVVLDRPGIGQTSVGRLQVGDIVVNLPYKSARWRAIQMASGRQGFVESATTRPLD